MNDDAVSLRFVRLREQARAPFHATATATGFDLFACLEQPGYLDIGPDPVLVPTGIALEAPPGCDVQLRPRSGLSARGVISVFGTLDADYRGEIFATLYTVGSRPPHRVEHGDRVGQIVVARIVPATWVEVESLTETGRGARGHGSTGR